MNKFNELYESIIEDKGDLIRDIVSKKNKEKVISKIEDILNSDEFKDLFRGKDELESAPAVAKAIATTIASAQLSKKNTEEQFYKELEYRGIGNKRVAKQIYDKILSEEKLIGALTKAPRSINVSTVKKPLEAIAKKYYKGDDLDAFVVNINAILHNAQKNHLDAEKELVGELDDWGMDAKDVKAMLDEILKTEI